MSLSSNYNFGVNATGITVNNINITGSIFQNDVLANQFTTTSGNLSYTSGSVVVSGLISTGNLQSTIATIPNMITTNITTATLSLIDNGSISIDSGGTSRLAFVKKNGVAFGSISSNNATDIVFQAASTINAKAVATNTYTTTMTISTQGNVTVTGTTNAVAMSSGNMFSTNLNSNIISAGNIQLSGNMTVGGNLIVGGSLTSVNVTSINLVETNITSGSIYSTTINSSRIDIGGTQPSYSNNTIGRLFITGTQNSAQNGPNILVNTSQDIYPTFNYLTFAHDTQWMMFDMYFDGTNFRNSHTTPGFMQVKASSQIRWMYSTASSAGAVASFATSLTLGSGGNIGLGGQTAPAFTLDVTGTGRFTTGVTIGGYILTSTGAANGLRIGTTSRVYDDGEMHLTTTNGVMHLDIGGVGDVTYLTNSLVNVSKAFSANFNSNTVGNVFTTGGNVGISTSSPSSMVTINPIVIDGNGFDHSISPLTVTQNSSTGTTVLNDQLPVLHLTRQGKSSQSYGARTTFALSRYENNGINSRTRLDIGLAQNLYDTSYVMSLRGDGNVGINNTSPSGTLHLSTGNTYANIIIEAGTSLGGGNQGYSAISWNGYVGGGGETRINTSKNRWRMWVDQRTTNDYMALDTYDGITLKRMITFNSNGNVVVGNSASGNTFGALSIQTTNEARYKLYNNASVCEWIFGQKSSARSDFTISTIVSAEETDFVTLSTSGNVSIGTTSTSYKLDVAGTARFTSDVYITSGSVRSPSTWTGPLYVNESTVLTSGAWSGYGAYGLYKPTSLTTALVCPSFVSGADVSLGIVAADSTFTTALTVSRFGDVYIGQNGTASPHYWDRFGNINTTYIAVSTIQGSGTINTIGSLFTASGNVGIGTTSPSYKLDVIGSSRITTRLDIGGTQPSLSGNTVGILSLTGSAGTINGPHLVMNTLQDIYPTLHMLNWGHDNVSINFDYYFDGNWRTSYTTSYQIYKAANLLQFNYANGSAGSGKLSTTAMCVSSQGNIGINQTNPSYTLDVTGTSRINSRLDIGGTQPSFNAATIGKLFVTGPVSSANGPHMVFNTTQDQYPNIYIHNWSHDISALCFDTYFDGNWRTSNANGGFALWKTSGQLQMRYMTGTAGSATALGVGLVMTTSGSIGIGTTSPTSKLFIKNSTIGNVVTVDGYSLGASGAPDLSRQTMIYMHRPRTASVQNEVSAQIDLGSNIANINGISTLDFKLSSAPAAGNLFGETPDTVVMSLLGNGLVGIGNTSPTATLDVAGAIACKCNTNGGPTAYLYVANTNSGSSAYSDIILGNDAGNMNLFMNSSTRTSDGGINTVTMRNDIGPLRFQSNAGSTVYLGSSGNVGINTTTPSSVATLDVNGNTMIRGNLFSTSVPNSTTAIPLPKAAANFFKNGSGLTVTNAYNCSITRAGTGVYNVTFTSSLSNATYIVTTGFQRASTSDFVQYYDRSTTGFSIEFWSGGSVADNNASISFVVY